MLTSSGRTFWASPVGTAPALRGRRRAAGGDRRRHRAAAGRATTCWSRRRTIALTGVFNRRHVEDVLRKEVERAQRHARPLAVAMLDADHFKTHQRHLRPPDRRRGAARDLGTLPEDAARRTTSSARYGGEEFVIVFPETNLEEAGAVAERLRAAVADEPDQGRRQRAAPSPCRSAWRRSRPGHDVEQAVRARRRGAVHGQAGRAQPRPRLSGAGSVGASARWTSRSQRLRNQRLVGQPFATPEEVVGWLGAVQAQDYAGAKWAIAQRTRAVHRRRRRAGLRGRPHPAHARAAADLALRAARRHPLDARADGAARARRDGLLRSQAGARRAPSFRRSQAVLQKALAGGKALTREELARTLGAAGIEASGQRLGHIMMRAELDALVTSGPRRGKQSTYALLDERAPGGRTLGARRGAGRAGRPLLRQPRAGAAAGLRLVVGADGG